MFYHIFYTLCNINLFQYITFRAGCAILTSLIITFFIAPIIIRYLKKYKIGQTVRDDGPKTHQVKSGTTTMGGIIIILSLLCSTVLWARLDNNFILWLITATVYFGMIGFVDDYLKLVKKNPKGLSAKKKLLFQSIFAILVIIYLYFYPTNTEYATSLNIPYLKTTFIEMSFLYFILIFLVIVGSSNAVNLTDGLDGLAIGNIIIAAATLAVFS